MRSLLDAVLTPDLTFDTGKSVAAPVTMRPHSDGIAPLVSSPNLLRDPDLPPTETHILLVEDFALSRKMMSIYLRRKGFHVHSFGTATEALGWSAFAAPAIILLDLLLPDINGLDLYDQLRAMPHLQSVPVLFVTAFDGARLEQQCLERGATAYFQKPALLPEIAACISRTLQL